MKFVSFCSIVALSLFLTGCGSSNETADENAAAGGNKTVGDDGLILEGQVVAQVNGEEITIHELNVEIARLNIPVDADRRPIEENVLRSIVSRKVFEQQAKAAGLDRSPEVLLDLRRTRSALLAQAYIRSRSNERPVVSRREADQYVLDNPDFFANRTYYIFDSIVVPSSSLPEELKDEYEAVGNLNDIESDLLAKDTQHQRRPYTIYSETLPAAMREKMPELQRDRTVFFLVQGANTFITQFQESRPAVLAGEEAIDAALSVLRNQKAREFLTSIELDAINSADIKYLGDFTSLGEQPSNLLENKIQDEIKDTVNSTDIDQ
ncbi:EpsD family peptidyl-prolyl cis-trans isomerase [Kordiimonas sp. SCSIO 12610]|uniref:EpsD family peptidyl-prolyl cis-trans isomerase n=1 Tax=Kordiimonas sp. SCSIO 12610 TaxID=2829597 RepID=UPI002108C575|nr:EpsD family peptidyl-prolyl cis-trans isomerase [Kordiimonas sp. SCSIO 12610]UTW55862.1 EpsD family peptidyl-prolyl cis-trans isomerase [Kordiimonas sp. SCSIO 12610]